MDKKTESVWSVFENEKNRLGTKMQTFDSLFLGWEGPSEHMSGMSVFFDEFNEKLEELGYMAHFLAKFGDREFETAKGNELRDCLDFVHEERAQASTERLYVRPPELQQ